MQSNNVMIVDDNHLACLAEGYGVGRKGNYSRVLDAAALEEMKKVPPRVTKLQKRLMSLREFFRGMQATQIAEAQRIYENFIKPKFTLVRSSFVERIERQCWAREASRYPDPVPPGKQHNAMARRRRQSQPKATW